jgi:hypothetical protein
MLSKPASPHVPIALLVCCSLALSAAACGAGAAETPAARRIPPLFRGALTDYVPAAGLRWMIAGSPAQLAREPALAPLRERWITDERRRAFATNTGVDVLATERAVAAGFELGTLYLADASGWIAAPERRFAERLAGSEQLRQPHPELWRVSGVVGSTPQALVRVDRELIAVAEGDPALSRVVELRALGRARQIASAFEGAALSTLPSELRAPQPIAAYIPGPLDPAAFGETTGLLAGALALGASLAPERGVLHFALALSGQWQPELDAPRLREAWQSLSSSALGHRLGLDAASPVDVAGSESLLTLRTDLDAGAFAAGVLGLLTGHLDDLTVSGRP